MNAFTVLLMVSIMFMATGGYGIYYGSMNADDMIYVGGIVFFVLGFLLLVMLITGGGSGNGKSNGGDIFFFGGGDCGGD